VILRRNRRGGRRPQRRVPACRPAALLACAAAGLPALLAALPGCRSPGAHPSVEPASDTQLVDSTGASGIPVHRPVPLAALAAYAGSEACVACHPRQAGQIRTHHAHTLARVDATRSGPLFQRSDRVDDPRLLATYRPAVQAGKCVLQATQGRSTEVTEAVYAFGSGNRAFTYLGRYGGPVVELRLTYYRQAGRWDFTPGQSPGYPVSTLLGRALEKKEGEECFTCHSTAPVSEAGEPRPARSILGVGCEACHGPGRAHIQAVTRGGADPDIRMVRLARFRDRVSTELCGQCHRTGEAGDPHDPVARAQIPRLQGLALSLSRCFQKSQGRLSCVTCHDPHRDATATSRTEYNGQCLSCHAPHRSGQVACKVQPAGDCVACHMPRQAVAMPTNPQFNTHWIRIWGSARK
jgi:hypothetical protein